MAGTEAIHDLAQYVDVEGALARVRGNKKIYRRMLGLLLQSQEFAGLEEALSAGDYAKASEIAHTIKGMTGNLSMPKLFELSEALMIQLREGPAQPDTLEQYRQAVPATRACVEQVIASFDAEG